MNGSRWGLRVSLMFFVGVVPAIALLALLLVMLPLFAFVPGMLGVFVAMGFLGMIGVVGLWGATFRDEQESVQRNVVAIPCVVVGLFPAVLYLIGIVQDSMDVDLLALVAVLLIGPIVCACYFLIEQLAHRFRRNRAVPNNSLERDAAKPRASG